MHARACGQSVAQWRIISVVKRQAPPAQYYTNAAVPPAAAPTESSGFGLACNYLCGLARVCPQRLPASVLLGCCTLPLSTARCNAGQRGSGQALPLCRGGEGRFEANAPTQPKEPEALVPEGFILAVSPRMPGHGSVKRGTSRLKPRAAALPRGRRSVRSQCTDTTERAGCARTRRLHLGGPILFSARTPCRPCGREWPAQHPSA
mmetsp:Transcript_35834/g.116159  ORF Transcript_35834/g.116159 Transcript_35834/m.116159 type:complete len:205 (-) Transcript_35834:2935-3549(-)